MVHRPEDKDDDRLEPATRWAKLIVRLEHLQNLFFIQRLKGKHGQKDLSELIGISFEMVSLTLLCWTHRDWFVGFAGDYEWLVSEIEGVPSTLARSATGTVRIAQDNCSPLCLFRLCRMRRQPAASSRWSS